MEALSASIAGAEKHPAEPGSLLDILRGLVLLYGFLLGIDLLGEGFKLLGGPLLDSFFRATTNPFSGLMVGILATSLVQSSSLTTSLIVGLVAAPENPLPLTNAIPMVMGANFGTTVTNTIVSLAHLGRRGEFRQAFAVSTCDDFFNVFAVGVILPLEIMTGLLEKLAAAMASLLTGAGGMEFESPISIVIGLAAEPLSQGLTSLLGESALGGIALAVLSLVLIFTSLTGIVRLMRRLMMDRVERIITRAFGRTAWVALGIGLIATAFVQSSSITTSMLVPLAGAGVLTLRQAFPIVLGANVGTTVTALLAALGASGPHAGAGLAIAFAHFLFNSAGILIFFPWPPLREIPLACSRKLADIGMYSPALAILYVAVLFYGLPLLFAWIYQVVA